MCASADGFLDYQNSCQDNISVVLWGQYTGGLCLRAPPTSEGEKSRTGIEISGGRWIRWVKLVKAEHFLATCVGFVFFVLLYFFSCVGFVFFVLLCFFSYVGFVFVCTYAFTLPRVASEYNQLCSAHCLYSYCRLITIWSWFVSFLCFIVSLKISQRNLFVWQLYNIGKRFLKDVSQKFLSHTTLLVSSRIPIKSKLYSFKVETNWSLS